MNFSFDRFYRLNRKAIIWVVLFGLIYLLRQFFTLIFLTFIISFFAYPACRYLNEKLKLNQGLSVIVIYSAITTGYIALYVFVLPNVIRQTGTFRARLPDLEEKWNEIWTQYSEKYRSAATLFNVEAESSFLSNEDIGNKNWEDFWQKLSSDDRFYRSMREQLPEEIQSTLRADENGLPPRVPPGKMETDPSEVTVVPIFEDVAWRGNIIEAINKEIIANLEFYRSEVFPNLRTDVEIEINRLQPSAPGDTEATRRAKHLREMTKLLDEAERMPIALFSAQKLNRFLLERSFLYIPPKEYRTSARFNELVQKGRDQLFQWLPDAALTMIRFFLTSLLAILFSFLIVFDYARLSKEVRGLATSRLRDFFVEASQPVINFAGAVGHGFQAIVIIALITTAMVVVTMAALKVSSLALLAVIAFVTSLIPVIGIFLEVIPVFLVALNEGGPETALWAMGALMVIHVIIGYVITPIIFGRRFKLNLVAVLFIIFIGNQLAGVWGMILGVPIANYILKDVLMISATQPAESSQEKQATEPPHAPKKKPDAPLPDSSKSA